MSYNAFGLKSMLKKEHIYSILDNLGVHGIMNDSNGFRSSCPIHDSQGNTVFVYNPDKHLYNCYGSCADEKKDGDIIKLVMLVQKCNFDSAVELICEWANLDKKLFEDSSDWLVEELKNKIETILIEANKRDILFGDIFNGEEYGVPAIPEELAKEYIGKKDPDGFIDSLGFKEATLTSFESGYDSQEKRWLLAIRSPDGKLLGFDGRDITGKSKSKWKKRKGLLTNKLLGRLDLSKKHILEKDEIILCEGKKDQMAIHEAGLLNVSCLYGSQLSDNQLELIGSMCSSITIFPDGDKAGYKMVKAIVDKAYPEYDIYVCETPDDEDPADLTTKFVQELYGNKLYVEEWLEKYKYRTSKK